MQKVASIIQILPDDFTRKVQLQHYYVGKVRKSHAHQVNCLVRGAQNPSPIDYLKRVKPIQGDFVEILLCQQHDEAQLKHIRHLIPDKLIEVFTREVPRSPPLTREQHKEWNLHWPTVFSQNDFEIITHTETQTKFIEGLAKSTKPDDLIIFTFDRVLLRGSGGCPPKSILHGVIKLLEEWPKCEAFSDIESNPKDHKLQKLKKEFEGYYYLTGLYLMTGRKVCQMCAMALVHSRLKRLYYIEEGEHQIGEIAYNRNLNHQYALLKVQI